VVEDGSGAVLVDGTVVGAAVELVGGVLVGAGAVVSGAVNGITSSLTPDEHAANNSPAAARTVVLANLRLATRPTMVTYSSRKGPTSRTEVAEAVKSARSRRIS